MFTDIRNACDKECSRKVCDLTGYISANIIIISVCHKFMIHHYLISSSSLAIIITMKVRGGRQKYRRYPMEGHGPGSMMPTRKVSLICSSSYHIMMIIICR